jgi:predicted Zn-dependent protease
MKLVINSGLTIAAGLRMGILLILCLTLGAPGALTTNAQSKKAPVGQLEDKNNPELIGKRDINKGNMSFYSLDREVGIGRQLAMEIDQSSPIVTDPAINEFVNRIAQNIVLHSDAKIPFTIKVIDSPEVNAFALPGGFLYVNRGLLEAAENEAEVAGVLAHEIAHVAGRHSARHLTKSLVTTGILLALGAAMDAREDDWRAQVVNLAAMVTAGSVMLKFSRNDEKQADREGVRLLEQAGYDPRGLLEFMQMLDAQQARSPNAVVRFLSTHPDPKSRVRDLDRMIGTPGPGRPDSAEFVAVKQRLGRLAPAQAMP